MISCYSNVPDNWRIIEGDGFHNKGARNSPYEDLTASMSPFPPTCGGPLLPKEEVQQASSWHGKTPQGLKAAHFWPQSPGTAISSSQHISCGSLLSNGHLDCPATTLSIRSFYPCRFQSSPNLSHPSGFKFISFTLPSSAIHVYVVTLSSTSMIESKIT